VDLELPDPVRRKALASGAPGERWLRDLPDIVATLGSAWGLTVGATMTSGTAAYVAAVTDADGRPAVLKVAMPVDVDGVGVFARSVTVLEQAAGRGAVRLLAHDDEHSALLLERLGPNLVDLGFTIDAQLVATCAALRDLWRPVPADTPLPTGAEKARWLAESIGPWWEELGHPCSARAVDTALAYAERRAAAFDPERSVLVHGDAHGWNTLRAGPGEYKLVDPEGLVSERAHDLAVPMRESHAELLAGDALALGIARAHRLGSLTGVPVEPIWQWGSIERVCTGLYCLTLAEEEWGRDFLAVADRWAEGEP
jgi:streptomycin 6-kinase